MKNRLIAIATSLLALSLPLATRAQSPSASPSKVGVINIQAAIGDTGEGKKAFGDLQKKYAPRQQELQRLQQEIQGINDQLSKQAATLSEDEQRRLSRELEDKQKILKRSTEDAQADFGVDRDEAIRRIGQKMVQVIGTYAKDAGFTLVLDSAQIPIYYVAMDTDITAEIVKRFDAANPVADAGSGPSTPPAAPGTTPKPATGTKPVVPATSKPKP